MKLIREAKDQMAVIKYASGNYRGFIERECRMRWSAHANWEIDPAAPPLYAEIDRASWRVVCDVCREAVVIDYGEAYFCPSCLNMAHGGRARVVKFPDKKERAAIETLLALRPNPNNRNWLPFETVSDIKNENAAQGIKAALE